MKATGQFDFEYIDALSIPMQEWIIANVELDDAECQKKK